MICQLIVHPDNRVEVFDPDGSPVIAFGPSEPGNTEVHPVGDQRLECWRDPDSCSFVCAIDQPGSRRPTRAEMSGHYTLTGNGQYSFTDTVPSGLTGATAP